MMINCLCIRTKNTIDHRRYLVNTLFKLNCINILVVQIMLVEDDGMITCEYDGWFSKGENNRRFSDTETIAITVLNHWLRLVIYKFFSCSPNITYV